VSRLEKNSNDPSRVQWRTQSPIAGTCMHQDWICVCVLYSSVCPRERGGGSDNGRKGSHLVASWDEMLKRLEPVVDLAPSLLQKRTKKTLFYDDRKCID
jgi:hypothetical protein